MNVEIGAEAAQFPEKKYIKTEFPFQWAARFGRFYFYQTPDLVSHWQEGFANCTPGEK
jgi:hypothetical protein